MRRWHHQLTHLNIHKDWSRNVFGKKFSKCHNFLISYPIFIIFAPICREIFTLSFEIMVILDWTSPLINVSKIYFMVFTKKKCNIDAINMCNSEIKQVSSLKFLGVIVDNKLNWSNHINFIGNNLSKNIGVLYRVGPKITEQ